VDEVAKQKDTLVSEVASLRAELQQVSEDRDSLLLQVQTLTAEVVNCEELVEKSNELKVCFKI
jgi:kinesin family protein C1